LFLLVADGAKVSAQISQSRARVNDGDAVRIGERDLQAGGVAAELLKTGIADGDGSPRTVKLELHRIVFMKVSFGVASIKLRLDVGMSSQIDSIVTCFSRQTRTAVTERGSSSRRTKD
jgi:hypothetical protein